MGGKEAIEKYKEWHIEKYGFPPTEKLINRFCEINSIEIKQKDVEVLNDGNDSTESIKQT